MTIHLSPPRRPVADQSGSWGSRRCVVVAACGRMYLRVGNPSMRRRAGRTGRYVLHVPDKVTVLEVGELRARGIRIRVRNKLGWNRNLSVYAYRSLQSRCALVGICHTLGISVGARTWLFLLDLDASTRSEFEVVLRHNQPEI